MGEKKKVEIPRSVDDWQPLTDDQLNDLTYEDALLQVGIASKMLMIQGKEYTAIEREWRELGVRYYMLRTQNDWLKSYVACVKHISRELGKQ